MERSSLEFINSQWYKSHEIYEDPLMDDKWFIAFLVRWELPNCRLTPKLVEQLIELRAFLYETSVNISKTGKLTDERIKLLNDKLKQAPCIRMIEEADNQYRLNTIPQLEEEGRLLYELVLDFSKLITQYSLLQFRQCSNPDCDWFFYDSSKSHTKKWCGNTCASLIKVRKHRAKK